MNTSAEDVASRAEGQPARFLLAVAVPLAIVAVAYALWSISDRLLVIGPFDRAAFGWAVVIPVWISAPVVGGLIWRRLPPRQGVLAAFVVGSVVSIVAAGRSLHVFGSPDCEFGAIRTADAWVLPSLALGLTIGFGLAISGVVTMRIARHGHPWRAVAAGAGFELLMVLAAILVAGATLLVPSCQRPPV